MNTCNICDYCSKQLSEIEMYGVCNECLYKEPTQKTIERVFYDSPHLQPDGKAKQQINKPSKFVNDLFESATFRGSEEEDEDYDQEILAELLNLKIEPPKFIRKSKYAEIYEKPQAIRRDDDLYRLEISKDKEIIKSWITDEEVPNRKWSQINQSIVKIDPDIPDGEDRRLLHWTQEEIDQKWG
jgi:hypothetical protein